jgi:hypothetical protein
LIETLVVEGCCPDVGMYSASTLNDMMALDDNVKLGFIQLAVHKRFMPFAAGQMRMALYAHTAASTNNFVVKTFRKEGNEMEQYSGLFTLCVRVIVGLSLSDRTYYSDPRSGTIQTEFH